MARNEFVNMKTALTGTLHDTNLNSQAGDWINETIHDLNQRSKFQYLHKVGTLTTVADQTEYAYTTIGTDVEKILFIRDQENDISLAEVSYVSLYQYVPDPEGTTSGPSYCYYIKDELLGLYPTPSGIISLKVDYKKRAVDLSADSDVPDLPIEFTDLILLGAEARGLRFLKRSEWVSTHQLYEAEANRKIAANQSRPNRRFKLKMADGNYGPPPGPYIPLWKT